MTDDLVKRLNQDFSANAIEDIQHQMKIYEKERKEAADRIEELEDENKRLLANAKSDAKWLAVYHHWCKMNGYAPSSADLSIARAALEKSND